MLDTEYPIWGICQILSLIYDCRYGEVQWGVGFIGVGVTMFLQESFIERKVFVDKKFAKDY